MESLIAVASARADSSPPCSAAMSIRVLGVAHRRRLLRARGPSALRRPTRSSGRPSRAGIHRYARRFAADFRNITRTPAPSDTVNAIEMVCDRQIQVIRATSYARVLFSQQFLPCSQRTSIVFLRVLVLSLILEHSPRLIKTSATSGCSSPNTFSLIPSALRQYSSESSYFP